MACPSASVAREAWPGGVAMRLTVLNVAYPFAAVGPDAVGGAEQVLAHLDQALTRAGHRSLVLACAGSVTAGTLLPLPSVHGTITEEARRTAHARCRGAMAKALREWSIDVIHLHGIDF